MNDRFFNLFSSPSGMFENEESYIFLQKEQRKNNGLTHKMEYRWQKRECICKKQKIILFTPVIWQGKIPWWCFTIKYFLRCFTRISSPEENHIISRLKLRHFFYVFDITNELLTRHPPFAPFDRLSPLVKAYSVYIINKRIHSRYGISFLVINLKRNLNLRAPMYYSLFIFCTTTWSCCVIRKIFSSGVTVILNWTIFSLRKLR